MSAPWLVLFVLLWVVCLSLVALVLGLSRRLEQLESRTLEAGAVDARSQAAEEVRGRLVGKQVADIAVDLGLVSAAGGMAGVVLFVSAQCGPCRVLASDLSTRLETQRGTRQHPLAHQLGTRVTIVTDDAAPYVALGASAVITDSDGALMNGFGITATPTGIGIDDRGVVVGALIANEFGDVEQLADAVRGGRLGLVRSA